MAVNLTQQFVPSHHKAFEYLITNQTLLITSIILKFVYYNAGCLKRLVEAVVNYIYYSHIPLPHRFTYEKD